MEVYCVHDVAKRKPQKRFLRFKNGDFALEDEECPGPITRRASRFLGICSNSHFKTFKLAGYIQNQ